jgi:PilZ domain-containing protein
MSNAALIPQPDRPSLPLRVPVDVDLGATSVHAEVLGSTENVLLIQGSADNPSLPALGTPVRLRLNWDRRILNGRLAAHGVGGRFLVTLGERAIRRSRRFSVDLSGLARSASRAAGVEVRITDLSTGGARVEGLDLPIGTELALQFAPPGNAAPIDVLGFVVRTIEPADVPTVGVAFRLVQPSMDVLGNAQLARDGR